MWTVTKDGADGICGVQTVHGHELTYFLHLPHLPLLFSSWAHGQCASKSYLQLWTKCQICISFMAMKTFWLFLRQTLGLVLGFPTGPVDGCQGSWLSSFSSSFSICSFRLLFRNLFFLMPSCFLWRVHYVSWLLSFFRTVFYLTWISFATNLKKQFHDTELKTYLLSCHLSKLTPHQLQRSHVTV